MLVITSNTVPPFYVYAYLDPRKPGNFIYGEFCFSHEPFYIGKGKNNRITEHLSDARSKSSFTKPSWLYHKIRKLSRLGLEPIMIKIKSGMHEEESLKLEARAIDTIGIMGLVRVLW